MKNDDNIAIDRTARSRLAIAPAKGSWYRELAAGSVPTVKLPVPMAVLIAVLAALIIVLLAVMLAVLLAASLVLVIAVLLKVCVCNDDGIIQVFVEMYRF